MLQERVAGGSMGVVYKALDRRLAEANTGDPFVAVKILSPQLAANVQALRALQQEAAKGRSLSHPNIVRFIDLDRDEDLYFIVMEWLDGRTLADILDSPDSSKVDPQRAFEIIEALGKALTYAHRCGIVHADVKPGNVMIMPNGDVKLLDFGVARVRQKQQESLKGFDPGILKLLTPAYSSMQVLTGEDPTPADDVFSLACLMYRLLAGYRVFGPRNAAEAAEAGMNPQCPHGLDAGRWRVLKKALAFSRIARYESVPDFINALNVNSGETISLVVPPRHDFGEYDEGQGAGRWIAGLVVLLGLMGFAAYQLGFLDDLVEQYFPEDSDFIELPAAEEPEIVVVDDPDASSSAEPVVPERADVIEDRPGPQDDVRVDYPTGTEGIIDTASEPVAVADDQVAEIDVGPLDRADQDIVDDAVLAETSGELTTRAEVIDFSSLPPATAEIQVDLDRSRPDSAAVTLREDGDAVTIDIVRAEFAFPVVLRLEEAGFSGNRSPWGTGQYTMSDDGLVTFAAGQERARVTLSMTSDPLREADQQSTLRLREAGAATSELATITVELQDDDQRAFEATMPVNMVAFATTQMTVRERDPAVQIDILRFNPDNTRLEIRYRLRDISATKGEDYFAPGNASIVFGPGQRNARLLIPLVQDTAFEDNEAFRVELLRDATEDGAEPEVFADTAIIIRDDDS
jgi:serine/threonine protein kinase